MKLSFQVFTIYLFFLTISFTSSVFAQCDEYYINELISGVDDKCYFPEGSPVRFCPRLKGIAINGTTFDVMQWDGISTQYLTLTKNGGIAGTVVLKLKEKELLVNLNGCGGARTYSISLNNLEYQNWKQNKSKELKLREETERIEAEKKERNIKLLETYGLNQYRKNLGIDKLEEKIQRNIQSRASYRNQIFGVIMTYSNIDSIVIDYRDGKIINSNVDFNEVRKQAIGSLENFRKTQESRDISEREYQNFYFNEKEFDSIGINNYLNDYFSFMNTDTTIDGTVIPITSRLIIKLQYKYQDIPRRAYVDAKLNGYKVYYNDGSKSYVTNLKDGYTYLDPNNFKYIGYTEKKNTMRILSSTYKLTYLNSYYLGLNLNFTRKVIDYKYMKE
jgi:hypothetical protein